MSTFFREVTFSIFDQRDGQKDDVTMAKKPSMLFQRWHRWRSVNGFAATSNPLPTLYCYDITGSNDRGG